jgi:hypothetical protein
MENNETNPGKRLSWPMIAGLLVVVVLILVGLFLPPISLGTRLGLGGGDSTADATTVDATAPAEDATAGELPEGVTLSAGNVAVSRVAVAELAAADTTLADAAAALPAETVGEAYVLDYSGDAPTGQIALPLPADAEARTIDLFGWDGTAWSHVPGQIDAAAAQAVAADGPLPRALIFVQSAPPQQPAVAVELDPAAALPADVAPLLTETSVGPLVLGENGALTGDVAELPQGADAATRFLRLTNHGAVVDQAALTALLDNTAVQDAQVSSVVGQAVAEGYAGIHLDYQGVPAAQSAAFTALATKLADALHAEGLQLALTLGTPSLIDNGWDTGGQNWAALGRLADVVYLHMPLDPTAYGDGGAAEQLVSWATGQIDRRKLNLLLTTGAVNKVGEAFTELPAEQALANLGTMEFVSGASQIDPGTEVEVALSGSATPLEWDGEALAYRYTFEQAGQPQTVWLVTEAALLDRLQLASDFNLRGATVRGLELGSGTAYAAALNSFLGAGEAPQPGGAAIAWTVRDAADSIVASGTGADLNFTWTTTENPGDYRVQAGLVLGDTTADLGELAVTVGGAVAEAPTATPEATAEAEATTAPTTGGAATPAATAATANLGAAGEATALVNLPSNIRTGPGVVYGTVAGGANGGTILQLLGRNAAGDWLQVALPSGAEGWISKGLVTINTGFDVNSLEVVEADAPLAAAPGATPASGAAAAPVIAPPSVAAVGNVGNFELGGQAAGMPVGNMQYAGMTWVKKQHKWNPGDSPDAVAGLINEAHASGMKILLSIPGQLYPSSIDFEAYTSFLGGVAALGPDAIEVWNEMNIEREWPVGQIDPASYVNNMLRPAYQKIKAANPNVMVITGAPAPTGYFGGCGGGGCDDAPYVAGMMAAGAGSVSDCIGVHYNEGLMPPSATSGDPRGAGGHYTRYFQGMINAYAGAGAGALCFTELGYLSGEEWGSLPAGFLWKAPYNLTVAEHAQYLAEAVRVGVQSGRVRMIIVFNVDFKTFGDDPQAGYAMIRPNGSCPACETLRSVMGR